MRQSIKLNRIKNKQKINKTKICGIYVNGKCIIHYWHIGSVYFCIDAPSWSEAVSSSIVDSTSIFLLGKLLFRVVGETSADSDESRKESCPWKQLVRRGVINSRCCAMRSDAGGKLIISSRKLLVCRRLGVVP